jgi:sodium/proline symporter
MDADITILMTLITYMVALILIGFWASRRTKDETDFFLGGRGLGPFVSGLSYAASASSAFALLGISGFVFAVGVSALWMLPGIWAGYIAVWLWMGPRLQAESKSEDHITITDFMVAGLTTKERRIVATMCALMITFSFVFFIAAQMDAAAKAFMDQFGLGLTESVIVGAIIIVTYSMIGGFWAVSVTDTLQAIVMVLVSVGLPVAAFLAVGGFSGIASGLEANAPASMVDPFGGMPAMIAIGFIIGTLSIGLGALGQPHMLSRMMAIKDEKSRRQGFVIAFTWTVAVNVGMAILGLAGRVLMPEVADGETLFYALAANLLPAVFAGIVIAAILSAVMSTVDSLLLTASSAIAHDLGLVRLFPDHGLLISRLTMAGIAIFSVFLTLSLPDSIFNRVLFAWSSLGAAFGPVIIARVAGREPNLPAITVSILAGFFLTVFFYSLGTAPVKVDNGIWTFLAELAHLPGDPFERFVPWIIPMFVLFLSSEKKKRGAV